VFVPHTLSVLVGSSTQLCFSCFFTVTLFVSTAHAVAAHPRSCGGQPLQANTQNKKAWQPKAAQLPLAPVKRTTAILLKHNVIL